MKSIATTSLFVFMTYFAFGQHKELSALAHPDSTHSEFDQIAATWLAAYNGPDGNALSPLYSVDAQYISAHVPGLVANGRDNVIANFQKGMSSGGHLESLEVLAINHSCDVATVLCQYNANNGGQRVSGRTLLILKKIGGKWLIALHMTVV
jgi:ketosteroid isomerase-like protein